MSDKRKVIAEDAVQSAMGSLGRWHILVCATIFLIKIPVAWHQMSIMFLAPPVGFSCLNNLTGNTTDVCSQECDHDFERSIFTETIITEWDLVCDRSYLANLSQTIVMLGVSLGNVVFGYLADRFGRKEPLVAAIILQAVTGIATSFISNFWLFCVLRFICAFATGGTMVSSFVLVMELVGARWRELMSVLYQFPFNLGHLTLPGFAYLFRDWHYLQMALSAPSVLLISYYWLVPESPRWLLAVGRTEKAVVILEKAAKCNKLPTGNIAKDIAAYAVLQNSEENKKGNLLDLIRTPNMRKRTIYIGFNWFSCGLVFFGVSQYMGQIGGDIFSNVAISAFFAMPGTVVCVYLMRTWGRRYTLFSANFLAGISCLLIAFVNPENFRMIVPLASVGVFGSSITFKAIYLYTGELYPTVIRNIAIGSGSMVARFGSMIAPFVAGLTTTKHWLPPIIFGLVPLIGAALCLLLPETMGCELPVTIEDGEAVERKPFLPNVDNKVTSPSEVI